MTISKLLELQKNNKAIAVVERETSITYEKLYIKSKKYSELLSQLTSKKANIGLLLPNSIPYITWYFAILFSDNIIVPIYYNSSPYEISNIVNSCDVSILISSESKFNEIEKCIFNNKISLINSETGEVQVLGKDKLDAIPIIYDDVVLMISTSGSLNNAKRVMLSNKSLLSNAQSIIESLKYTNQDVFLIILPLCFASANTSQLLVSFIIGAKICIYNDVIHPRNICNAIKMYEVTTITVVPAILKMLVEEISINKNTINSLKTLAFGGAPTPRRLIQEAYDKFNFLNLVHMYGQTEASTRITHFTSENPINKLGSVGKPLRNIKIKIVDDNFIELMHDQEGEVVISGDNIMTGYYKQESESKKVLQNGWLLTGDIGKIDSDGYLYITGRKRNVIIYSGINIYPEEIESVILTNFKVLDVLVYGSNSPEYGEIPIADVVLKDGYSMTDNELFTYCSKFLPLYKIPHKFNYVRHLDKTSNGKIKRRG